MPIAAKTSPNVPATNQAVPRRSDPATNRRVGDAIRSELERFHQNVIQNGVVRPVVSSNDSNRDAKAIDRVALIPPVVAKKPTTSALPRTNAVDIPQSDLSAALKNLRSVSESTNASESPVTAAPRFRNRKTSDTPLTKQSPPVQLFMF